MASTIEIRAVERFDEPAFTDLVAELLWEPDRREVAQRFLDTGRPRPTPTHAQQVRLGAFDGDTLVGWSHAVLNLGGVLHVASSAVRPAYRRQGLYTRLVAAMEDQAHQLACTRIESHHRTANSAVLIAKLKAGYTIVGTEFTMEMGLLVKMAKLLDARGAEVFQARAGVLEGSARLFGR